MVGKQHRKQCFDPIDGLKSKNFPGLRPRAPPPQLQVVFSSRFARRKNGVPKKPLDTETKLETSNHLAGGEKGAVLLQTASATVVNKENGRSLKAHILFDSGSQLSYITPGAKSKLGLHTAGQQEMCIKSFGGARHTKTFEYVEFAVNTNSSVENIKAFVSEISYPLSGQNIAFAKQTFSHLRNIKLADDSKSDTPIDIDILIGSDYYWEFIEGKTIKREILVNLLLFHQNLDL